jgi:hypothetical protein
MVRVFIVRVSCLSLPARRHQGRRPVYLNQVMDQASVHAAHAPVKQNMALSTMFSPTR